jgi:hypothetical protein
LNEINPIEGTGCIDVSVWGDGASARTSVIRFTNSTSSWDLSGCKYIKVKINRQYLGGALNHFISFGESTYNENTSTAFTSAFNTWETKSYDISAIGTANRDAVTIITVQTSIPTGELEREFLIDDVYCDPGPSRVVANDGVRQIQLYPKITCGAYTGDGTTGKTVYISDTSNAASSARKGTPAMVTVLRSTGNVPVLWMKGMAANYSLAQGGVNARTLYGITGVGDGYFTVASTERVNNAGDDYLYCAMFED